MFNSKFSKWKLKIGDFNNRILSNFGDEKEGQFRFCLFVIFKDLKVTLASLQTLILRSV